MADQTLAQTGTLIARDQQSPSPCVERVVPGETGGAVYLEHLGRYEFASNFVRGMRALDVACGSGYGAQMLYSAGARSYLGVDISPEAIRLAESRYKVSEQISFVLDDACVLGCVRPRTIDVAVSFETIEHLTDPRKFLASVRDALVPGGTLIVSTPNRDVTDPAGTIASKPLNPFHIREWSRSEFVRFLGGFFKVEQVLGQIPHPRWKVFARHVTYRHRCLKWVQRGYVATRPLRGRASPRPAPAEFPVPVEAIKPWQCQTYVVCLCRNEPKT